MYINNQLKNLIYNFCKNVRLVVISIYYLLPAIWTISSDLSPTLYTNFVKNMMRRTLQYYYLLALAYTLIAYRTLSRTIVYD